MTAASRGSRRSSVLLGVLVLVLVAACGGDGDDAASPPASATAPTDVTVAVGATQPPAPASTDPMSTAPMSTAPMSTTPNGSSGLTVAGVDPCGLLSVDQIEAVVEHPVVAGEPQPLSCLWDSETLDDSAVTVTLYAAPIDGVAGACADQRALDPDASEVAGFGSAGWWVYNAVGPPYDSGDLWFCVDDGIVAVSLSGAGDEALWRSQVEQLAGTVVAGL